MDAVFYTVQEVAKILSLSEQTIRMLIREGKLQAIRLGRTYCVPYESLVQLRTSL